MLEMDYLERMEQELWEQQQQEWEDYMIIAWPWDEWDYAA